MPKTILITGATDGIGLAAATLLASQGHSILLHGRSREKLESAERALKAVSNTVSVETYRADLSQFAEIAAMTDAIRHKHTRLDVVVNNAGVFKTETPVTPDGLDMRFVVNTLAPYYLTSLLLPTLHGASRVINLSSAALAPVDLDAMSGRKTVGNAMSAYAQSKLALAMWSCALANSPGTNGPAVIALNPGSMLGTKMVREGFGVSGGDIRIGAEIVASAATADEFADASGRFFDNDAGRFAMPHPDMVDQRKCAALVKSIETILVRLGLPLATPAGRLGALSN